MGKVKLRWIGVASFFLFLLAFNSFVFPQNLPLKSFNKSEKSKENAKIESRVLKIIEEYNKKGKIAATTKATSSGAKFKAGGLELEISIKVGYTELVKQKLNVLGVKVTGSYMHLIQVETSPELVPEIKKINEVNFIKIPSYLHHLGVTSEGVSAIGGDVWQGKGLDGTGVKIGIIDSFQGYTSLLGTELPATVTTQNYGCSPAIEGDSKHGTAVAEIIYDFAPKASYYFVCTTTGIEFGNAIDYLISQGVHVINASIGWSSAQPCDAVGGGDVTCSAVKKARDAGILYVNASGNEGEQHWGGSFKDTDSDGFHEWSGIDELNAIGLYAGTQVTIYLKWNDWSSTGGNQTNQDFDLILDDGFGNIVAGSAADQAGSNNVPPLEIISYIAPATGLYYIVIQKFSATTNVDFDLITYPYDLKSYGYYTKSRSVSGTIPGDSPFAFSVGAVGGPESTPACSNDVLVSYSSQGPTNDGRVKPDISAPTGVSTQSYGARDCNNSTVVGFNGTSAATPHIVGLAALVKQKFPTYTADQIQSYIESHSKDLGSTGKDNEYGYGGAQLDITAPSTIANLSAGSPAPDSLTLAWTAPGDDNSTGTATSYDVRYFTSSITDANFSSATQVSSVPAPKISGSSESLIVSGLSAGTTYYFAIKTSDELPNVSAISNIVSASTKPPAPTGFTASPGNSQVTVSWSPFSGATSYNLYMASQSGVTKTNYATLTEGMQHTGVTSPYTHTGLTNGKTYYFVVTAVNSGGESSESTEVSAKPVLETTAPVISSMSASDAGDTATITWTTDEPSDSIVDYGTTTGYGSTATSASLVSYHSVTLTGLSGNTSYNYRVKSADTWGNTATSPNAAFTTKTKLKYTFPKGLTMISLPLAVSSSAASLFGSALEKFGKWNPQGNAYDVSSSFNFSAGNGYWVKLASDKYFEVTGTPAPATQNFEVAIYPGWNQVGNPFLQTYLWENVSVKNKQSGVTKKLTDAAAAQWVGSYAWSYPGQAFGYQLTHPDKEGASRYLSPLYGYWIYSGISGTLVFHYDKIGTATAQKSGAESSDTILSVQLKAVTDAAADDGSFFGITKTKTEDAIQKPPDPIENRLKTYFAGAGKQTASDFHFNPSQKEQVWDFIVECDGTKNVTLSWDIKTLPPGAKLYLQDMESGAPLTMTGQNSMTVSVNEKKTFKIKYYKPSALSESGENGALFASKPYMFPNPDRTGNATFRYVTGPNVMRVGIEVYNLAGKLVDKFDGDLNGETHWLFGDRVAAGVYYYRITAYAADGKESVVGKMVVVR